MTDLLECRKEIDVIDKEILRLFEKRAGQNRSPERICSWGIQ